MQWLKVRILASLFYKELAQFVIKNADKNQIAIEGEAKIKIPKTYIVHMNENNDNDIKL